MISKEFKAYNKDKKVKIFQLVKSRDENGNTITKKKYIHPIDSFIRAYYRDLSIKEKAQYKQLGEEIMAFVIIGKRYITSDMYLEYKPNGMHRTMIFNILGADKFTDSGEDIKLSLNNIRNTLSFDEVEGTQW